MIRLQQALAAWQTPAFNSVLKAEIEALDPDALPLQAGLSRTSYATGDKVATVILASSDAGDCLRVKAGLFYAGIIAGCSCADDPTPVDEVTEYCEILLEIDKATAEARVSLLAGEAD